MEGIRSEDIAEVLCSEKTQRRPWLAAVRRVVWVGLETGCMHLQANGLFHFSKTFSSSTTLDFPKLHRDIMKSMELGGNGSLRSMSWSCPTCAQHLVLWGLWPCSGKLEILFN